MYGSIYLVGLSKTMKICQHSQHLYWDFSSKSPKRMSSVVQLYQADQLNHSWMTSPSFMIAFSCYLSRHQTYWTSLSCTYDKRKVQEMSCHKDGLQCSTVLNFLYISPRNLDISYKCLPPDYRSGTKIFPSPHFFMNRVQIEDSILLWCWTVLLGQLGRTTWQYITEDWNLQQHCCENL